MPQRPEGLPSYARPPIDEVAIAVQFDPIVGLQQENLREFWRSVRDDYPSVEWRPPGDVPIETPTSPPQSIQFVINTPDRSRVWLVSDTDDYLVQVQDTTLVQNWRRREAEYGRFESVREQFVRNYERFCRFLEHADLPQPKILQAEVTYINWLPLAEAPRLIKLLGDVAAEPEGDPIPVEDMNWMTRYRLTESDSAHTSRLYSQLATVVRASNPGEKGIQFSLVARTGFSKHASEEVMISAIDHAREQVVRAFDRAVTPEAHIAWGRR